MRLLFDENTPRPLIEAVRAFARDHVCDHVKLIGWSGTLDPELFKRAADDGYDALVTNDKHQLRIPEEVKALAESGIHRIEYGHSGRGFTGLGLAIGSICAGLPFALRALADTSGQRLVKIRPVVGGVGNRVKITDPSVDYVHYWPGADAQQQ